MATWSSSWNMCFNALKCIHVRFGGNGVAGFNYSINGLDIASSSSHKDLGVLLTNWSPHIKHISSKAYSSFCLIKRAISPSADPILKRSLYISLVRSHLVYCSQVWRPLLVKDSAVLEKIQRRASKFILGYPREMDYKDRLINLNILPISLYLEVQDILFFIKLLKFPPDNFSIADYVSFLNTTTRSSTSLHKIKSNLPMSRLSSTNHFYFIRIVRIWNSLPPIDLSESFATLRSSIFKLYWNYFITHYSLSISCSWCRICLCSTCSSLPLPT